MFNHPWSFRLLLFALVGGSSPASPYAATLPPVAPADTSRQATEAALRAYVQQQVERGFAGAVLVARGNTVLLQQQVGANATASTSPTAYWLGSTSKQFAAAAVLKLAEQGRLQLTDALPKFFPNTPADKQGITLHQLLTHSAGLADLNTADGITQPDKAAAVLLNRPLAAPVGAGYRYSSDGYNLLALVVEKAGGMPYEQYLRTQLLAPAGLQQTGFWGEEIVSGVALAPVQDARRTREASTKVYKDGRSQPNYGYRGATGMYSTTADFHRWLQALRGGQVLSPASLQQLFAPSVPVRQEGEAQVHYGYGWVVVQQPGRPTLLRHTGAEDWLGHNSFAVMQGDLTIVVLSNAGEPNGKTWSRTVAEGLLKKMVPPGG